MDTDTLPELVSAPTPDEIAMDPPEAKVGAPRHNWDMARMHWDVACRRGYGRGDLQVWAPTAPRSQNGQGELEACPSQCTFCANWLTSLFYQAFLLAMHVNNYEPEPLVLDTDREVTHKHGTMHLRRRPFGHLDPHAVAWGSHVLSPL